jgi:hypothetical protein
MTVRMTMRGPEEINAYLTMSLRITVTGPEEISVHLKTTV